ncbi:VOC family protein [Actinoplanes couchii]|uniref:Glyoxalase/bleomycin resistance protein n=1 Tax=Actinoplanes couchii TaxID=403638 RepID=A0ABQ3XJ33_9ACTN|nr:VOC family protein [Actinoplanes couchii]MDR6323957.1 putative enzyme related to lactoylglutathione lyase [Actinoplanes couchii]GID58425.1 putative glyoxalase/bleomycin resistance protein [Actinoplanes couchii]
MNVASPGVPNWIDLATADLDDAIRFYTAMFGWTAEISGDDLGGYTTFLLNGLPAAGAGPLFGEGQVTAWSTYFAASDADAVAARVEAAYGKVLVPPFDVGDQGRMAAFLDPAGAPFSVWEPGTMRGAEVVNIPGALTWSELNTRDLEGAANFYHAVFGWQFRSTRIDGLPYLLAELNQAPVAGIQLMAGGDWPDDLPAHWQVHFAVGDCDGAVGHALGLGGRLVRPPANIPGARFAVLADPQGGTFAILHKHR